MKKRTDNFDKFANPKKGSAIKEAFRQEKKKIKQEARAAGEEMRRKKIEKMRGITPEKEDKPQAAKFRSQDKGKPGAPTKKYEAKSQKSGIKGKETSDSKPQTPNAKPQAPG